MLALAISGLTMRFPGLDAPVLSIDQLRLPAGGHLAITGASNVTGEVLPIAELADIAHRCGARILIDGAQLTPHRRVNLAETGVGLAPGSCPGGNFGDATRYACGGVSVGCCFR